MIYSTLSDQDLVTLFKEGDHKAYTEIYHRYSSILYVHGLKWLKDPEEAKDILQELFTTFWVNRAHIQIQHNLSGYLYTAMRNRVLKAISRKEIATRYTDSLDSTAGYDKVATDYLIREQQLSDLIEKEIDSLPPRMRDVFLLSRSRYLSHREIASNLSISELTVKKQVANAVKILRTRLAPFVKVVLVCFFLDNF